MNHGYLDSKQERPKHYCHLSMIVHQYGSARRGNLIGLTGNTGNASTMLGEDRHLHFEVRTTRQALNGLEGRLDPAKLYGRAPIGWNYYKSHGQKLALFGTGLKMPHVSMRRFQMKVRAAILSFFSRFKFKISFL